MSATTIPAPSHASGPLTHGLRIALVSLAIVVLLALSFVSGRATVTTTSNSQPTSSQTSSRSGTSPTRSTPTTGRPASAPTADPSNPRTCHMVPDC